MPSIGPRELRRAPTHSSEGGGANLTHFKEREIFEHPGSKNGGSVLHNPRAGPEKAPGELAPISARPSSGARNRFGLRHFSPAVRLIAREPSDFRTGCDDDGYGAGPNPSATIARFGVGPHYRLNDDTVALGPCALTSVPPQRSNWSPTRISMRRQVSSRHISESAADQDVRCEMLASADAGEADACR